MRLTAYATIAFASLVASGAAITIELEGDMHFPIAFGLKNKLGIKHKSMDKIDSADTAAAKADYYDNGNINDDE